MHIIHCFQKIVSILLISVFITSSASAQYLYLQNNAVGDMGWDIKAKIYVRQKDAPGNKKSWSKIVRPGEREWIPMIKRKPNFYRRLAIAEHYCIDRIDFQLYPPGVNEPKYSMLLKNSEKDSCNDLGILLDIKDSLIIVAKVINDANIENLENPFDGAQEVPFLIVPYRKRMAKE
jgi:hypothetical protein